MEFLMNTDILKASGLSQVELADLFGVSRVTINSWIAGRFKPHALHRDRIERCIDALRKAVDAGELPLSAGVDKHLRVQQAKAIVEGHI